jgi:hypothetical protein
MSKRISYRTALLVLILAATGVATYLGAQQNNSQQEVFLPDGFATDLARRPVDFGFTDPALIGAIDLHVHVDPDSPYAEQTRAIDVMTEARVAKARGMRGFAHKTHNGPESAATALIVRQEVPGIEVFGRFPQNFTSGGLNIAAVDHFIQITGGFGRIVEMPTRDAITSWQEIQKTGMENRSWMQWRDPDEPKYIALSKDGKLLPEVVKFIGKLAKMKTVQSNASVVLATGHALPEEHVLLAREGRRVGLQVLATHPHEIPQLEEIAKTGAYVELTAAMVLKGVPMVATNSSGRGFQEAMNIIHRVGAEHIIISSDAGQITNPYPPDVLALVAKGLRSRGVTEHELDLMYKINPAKLLGLPPLDPSQMTMRSPAR